MLLPSLKINPLPVIVAQCLGAVSFPYLNKPDSIKLLLIAGGLLLQFSLAAQNVGIGTGTPSRARLEVHGVSGAGNTSAIFGGDGPGVSIQRNWPTIGFNQYRDNTAGNGRYMANGYAAIQYLDPVNGKMAIDIFSAGNNGTLTSAGTRTITIAPNGNMSIGGANTNAPLQFTNGLANRKIVLYESANNDHQYYGFGIQNATLRYNVDAPGAAHKFYAADGSGSSSLLMTVGGNKKVVIGTQNGGSRVGINSNDPMYALEIVQADHTGLVIIDPATYNNWELKTEQVGSNGNYLFFRYNGGGGPFIQPDGSYHSGSDVRIKENIEPMPALLTKLMLLKPKTYAMKFNNPGKKRSIGIIAQELEAVFPELTSVVDGSLAGYNDLKELHTINYAGLGVIAIKAIQEQQEQIEALNKIVKQLVQKIESLEARMKIP